MFAMESWHGWAIAHMDIVNAYVHENDSYEEPILVKEPDNERATYTYGETVGLLKRNVWGGKSAGYYYIESLIEHL